MDLQYYGANCVVLSTKGVRLVLDDNLTELGFKAVARADDILLYTGAHGLPQTASRLIVDGPGEYEVSGLSVVGIAVREHMGTEGTKAATMYKIMTDDANYLLTGHIYPDLSDEQLESIGTVDVMVVPVGGNGYTLDPVGALQLIKKIEPKVVIPTHYDDDAVHYPVSQQSLDQALKNLGMEPKETLAKWRFKPAEVGDTTQLVGLGSSQGRRIKSPRGNPGVFSGCAAREGS